MFPPLWFRTEIITLKLLSLYSNSFCITIGNGITVALHLCKFRFTAQFLRDARWKLLEPIASFTTHTPISKGDGVMKTTKVHRLRLMETAPYIGSSFKQMTLSGTTALTACVVSQETGTHTGFWWFYLCITECGWRILNQFDGSLSPQHVICCMPVRAHIKKQTNVNTYQTTRALSFPSG